QGTARPGQAVEPSTAHQVGPACGDTESSTQSAHAVRAERIPRLTSAMPRTLGRRVTRSRAFRALAVTSALATGLLMTTGAPARATDRLPPPHLTAIHPGSPQLRVT